MTVRVAFVVVLVGVVVSGCAIGDNRDGIGRSCTTDTACPLDHFCALDGPVDAADAPAEGRCVPVLDYGACDEPTWPVKEGRTLEGDQTIDDAADLVLFDDATVIDGGLRVRRASRGVIALGDLCGLAGLQRVSGIVAITETDATTLHGLQALSSVGGGIVVADNAKLVDVSALANLQFAPPPDGRDAAVLFARNALLEKAAIDELRTILRDAGIGVVDCGNAGAATACSGTLTGVLDRL